MKEAAEFPMLPGVFVALLLFIGAVITLIGSLGLLRLRTFYERVHATTLGTTLGTVCIAFASMIYLSASGTQLVLHELLIIAFVILTTPITLMILVRAAGLRDQSKQVGANALRSEDRS